VTVHEVVALVHVNEPGAEITVYELIEAPPVETGAVHDTTDDAFAAPVAPTEVGAPGTDDGTTGTDATDAALVPDAFVAVTLKVYAMPLVRPVTVHGFERPHENDACAAVPTNAVTVNPRTAAPPFETGAVQVIVERVDKAPVAATPVGAVGTVDGVAVFEASDAPLVPALFVAVTVNV